MKKQLTILLDFEVDKLTNSIENCFSGDSFPTEISFLTQNDLKQITKKSGWLFNWGLEFKQNDRDVYKLTIQNNPNIIQGLMSITVKSDHVYMHLLESAPFNLGKIKIYQGVPGNLVAYACKISFQHGNDGFVSFQSKTQLIEHYEKTLGAYHFGGHLMVIPTISAKNLLINTLNLNTMGLIREPDGIDFYIQSKPLTKDEEIALSEYIRAYKAKNTTKSKTDIAIRKRKVLI